MSDGDPQIIPALRARKSARSFDKRPVEREKLDALVEATRGNIATEDKRLLLDVVGSLKLSFMEVTKAAAKAMQEKAKARP